MTPLHLMTIVGTRPEIIRLSAVIRCCDRYFRQTLVHTGQNWDYTLHGIFFQDLGLRPPDRQLHVAGSHLGQTLGNVLSQSYQLLQELRPDAVLLLGDTNSCLSAISAKRLQIPIFHMEAGNRCFDSRVPEEINRRIVDVTADYHLCYTEHARRNLLAMGLPPDRIFVTGSPMPEVLSAHLGQIQASPVLERLGLEPQGYFLLSAHREENIDTEEAFLSLLGAVNCLAEQYGKRRAASSAPTAFPSPPSASAPSPSGPKLWSAVPSSCPVSGKSRCSLPWRRPFPWPHKKTWAPRCRTIRMRRSPAKWPPFCKAMPPRTFGNEV